MAWDLHLELEGASPDWQACADALRATGVGKVEIVAGRVVEGYFEKSGMPFWLGADRDPRPIVAEGYHGCNFLTRDTLCFRWINAYNDECIDDLKTFLTDLSQRSPMQFVLSAQYESVYATHCKQRGFEWLWDTPRDENWRPPISERWVEPPSLWQRFKGWFALTRKP